MSVRDQKTRLSATFSESKAINDIIEARFENLQQVETCQTTALRRNFIIAVELPFQNAVNTAGFLFGTQLTVVVRLPPVSELSTFTMLTRSISPAFEGTFRCKAAFTLQEQFFAFAPA